MKLHLRLTRSVGAKIEREVDEYCIVLKNDDFLFRRFSSLILID